jgi:thioredoxin reductase (NADPH)
LTPQSGELHAATALEGALCRGATVVVAGAGNSAGQPAMFLAESAEKVLLVVRGNNLSRSMSDYLSRRIESASNIEVLYHTEIRTVHGAQRLEAIEIENVQSGERRNVATPAAFSMIGANPCTNWLPPAIERDDKGFILTGRAVAESAGWQGMKRMPAPLDERAGSVRRR